jgi:hypothetical protein
MTLVVKRAGSEFSLGINQPRIDEKEELLAVAVHGSFYYLVICSLSV